MTVSVGRVGDIGIGVCAAHTSPRSCVVTLVSGAPTANVNGLNTATAITVGVSSCGHASIVLSFSALAKAENAGIHRVGDVGALPGGLYTLVTGSPNSRAGG
jgi:hypothetical protein